jgi:hypothetical protein
VLYCCLSLSCFLIASSTTYGLGGFLRYGGNGAGSGSGAKAGGDDGMWQFFQPFSGGLVDGSKCRSIISSSSSGSSISSSTCRSVELAHCLMCSVLLSFSGWLVGWRQQVQKHQKQACWGEQRQHMQKHQQRQWWRQQQQVGWAGTMPDLFIFPALLWWVGWRRQQQWQQQQQQTC